MPDIIFGPNTYFAVKRWPEAAAWADIAQGLGVTDVQFCFDLLDPVLAGDAADYGHVRRVCDARGIRISSAFTGFIGYVQSMLGHPESGMRARAEEWYESAIAAAAELGCSAVGGHLASLSIREFSDPASRSSAVRRTREAVLRLTDVAARRGLAALLWEVMPVEREYPARMDEVEELIDELGSSGSVPVRLCLDVGHACLSGAPASEHDPYAWLERFGPHAHTIHLQQTDGIADRHWSFTDEFNRSGIIERARIGEIVARLPQPEVELMLECVTAFEASDAQALDELRASLDYWAPTIAALQARAAASTDG